MRQLFLELAGVEIPADIQGKSLVPLIEGKNTGDWRKAIYYHYYEYQGPHAVKRHYGIRTDRYKLIHFYNDVNQWELYDLAQDSLEIHNLYGMQGYEEITKSLFEQLINLQTQYKDTTAVDVRLN